MNLLEQFEETLLVLLMNPSNTEKDKEALRYAIGCVVESKKKVTKTSSSQFDGRAQVNQFGDH